MRGGVWSLRRSRRLMMRRWQRRGFGTVAAREDGHVAAGISQFAGELFHDGRFAGAANRQVADGDDLYAEGLVTQDTDVIEPAAELDEDLKILERPNRMTRVNRALKS